MKYLKLLKEINTNIMNFEIKKIFINRASLKSPLAEKVCNTLTGVPVIETDNDEFINEIMAEESDPVGYGKKVIYITRNEGDFLKKCPGTKKAVCCNYYILNLVTNCPLDCTYCILQQYLQNNPVIKIFSNIEDLFSEVDSVNEKMGNSPIRIGTGELSDSLALDDLTGFSIDLIKFFKKKENIIFELKTKTANIDNLLSVEGAQNIVIGWSLNPQKIIDSDEKGSVSLNERILSAKECEKNNYSVAFHFDPVIIYDGCEDDYCGVIDKITSSISPESIAWISIGALRFPEPMKWIMKERFPQSDIIFGEQTLCEDRKYRYIRPLREEIFKKMYSRLKKAYPDAPVYLCMEESYIWNDVAGALPNCINKTKPLFGKV